MEEWKDGGKDGRMGGAGIQSSILPSFLFKRASRPFYSLSRFTFHVSYYFSNNILRVPLNSPARMV